MRWEYGLIILTALTAVLVVVIGGVDMMFWNATMDMVHVSAAPDLVAGDCKIPVQHKIGQTGPSFITHEQQPDGTACNNVCLASSGNTCVGGHCTGQCAGECPLPLDETACPDIVFNNISLFLGLSTNLSATKMCAHGKCWYAVFNLVNEGVAPFFMGALIESPMISGRPSLEIQRRLSDACMDLLDRTTPGLNTECLTSSWINLVPSLGVDVCFYTYGCAHFADFAYSTNPDFGLAAASSIGADALSQVLQERIESRNFVAI